MSEQNLLTILILVALFINCLGFLFFALSLTKDKSEKHKPNDYESNKPNFASGAYPYTRERKVVEPQTHKEKKFNLKAEEESYSVDEDEDAYQVFTPKKEYEETPMKSEVEESPYQFSYSELQNDEEVNVEDEEENELDNPYQFKFDDEDEAEISFEKAEGQPVNYTSLDVEDEEDEEYSKYQFRHRPKYEEKEELDDVEDNYEFVSEDTINNEQDYSTPREKTEIRSVDYADEVEKGEKTHLERGNKYEEKYQFKHAYTKDERYKYEYGDYKNQDSEEFEVTQEEAITEEIDYDIDVDKEHEKFYGNDDDDIDQKKYSFYLDKANEKMTEEHNKSDMPKSRKLFEQTDLLNKVPQTPLDEQEEGDAEETINVKQFEPLKYKEQPEEPAEEEFDEQDIDRRLDYLMGKMNIPNQKKGKPRGNPLDEEI